MISDHNPVIVNAIGHLAGAIVFGIFLVLALRGAAGRRARENWLSVASAGLAWTVSFRCACVSGDGARTRRIASGSPMPRKQGIHVVADAIAEVVADDVHAIQSGDQGIAVAGG